MQQTITVNLCDRCKEARTIEFKISDDRELCGRCAREFATWWNVRAEHTPASAGKNKNRYLRKGEPVRIAHNIIAIHGCVTARDYAAATGQCERTAYWSLRNLALGGALRKVKLPRQPVRYELPLEQGAAE